MKQKIMQWGVGLLSMMVLLVGTSTIKLPSHVFFYQPEVPEALRRDK